MRPPVTMTLLYNFLHCDVEHADFLPSPYEIFFTIPTRPEFFFKFKLGVPITLEL